jgi:hypothetical protein
MGVHVMVEGAIVSYGPVPICLWLVWCYSGPSDGGEQKSSTSSESTSRKSLDCRVWKSSALGVVPGDGTEVRMGNTYEQGESMRGEERRGEVRKRMDVPLQSFPFLPQLSPSFLLSLSPPPIGSYIWSTQSRHGAIICWHHFHSQLQVAEWRQIK